MRLPKRKKTWVIFGLLFVLIVILIARFGSDAPTDEQVSESNAPVAQLQLADYQTATAPVFASGIVEAADQMTIHSQVNAPAAIVHKRIGDVVVAGEPIVTFSQIDIDGQITQAAAAVDRAQASLDATAAPARAEDIRRAEAAVEGAGRTLEQLRLTREQTVLTNRQSLDNTASGITALYEDALSTLRSSESTLKSALVTVSNLQSISLGCSDEPICFQIANAKESAMALAYNVSNAGRWNALSVGSVTSGIPARVAQINAATADGSELKQLLTALRDALVQGRQSVTLSRAALDSHLGETISDAQRAALDGERAALDASISTLETVIQQFDLIHGGELADGTPKKLDEAQRLAKRSELVLDAQINGQKAALESAQASLDALLAGPRAVDLAPLERAVLEAQAAYNSAIAQASKYTVFAPFEGTITSLPVNPGQISPPGSPVVTIANPDFLEVTAYISATTRESISFHDGLIVDGEYSGVINAISSGVDPLTGKVELTIGIVGPAPGLIVGEVVSIEINQERASEQGYIVPFSAVKTIGGGTKVFVNDNGYARGVWVETGDIIGDRIEIFLSTPQESILQNVRGIEEGAELN